jgi:PncC family amidohydrolase
MASSTPRFGTVLRANGTTLAVAESITAGNLAALICATAGASDYFLGGVIAYQDEVKIRELKVAKRLITRHTAVSSEVAAAMAIGAKVKFSSDYAISTTGVAGPGAAYGAPAGTVWVGIATPERVTTIPLALKAAKRGAAARVEIQNLAATSAIAAFERILCA